MSTSGVFQLVTNTGKQDELLNATKYLMQRVKNISRDRLAQLRKKNIGKSDRDIIKKEISWMPTLKKISQSHSVFVYNTYKPFVATAYEYVKTSVTKGNTLFDNKFTFTLPQFGQFVSDMVIHIKIEGLQAVAATDRVRWAEFLGHRLLKEVQFTVNGNLLDTITTNDYNAHWQFKVPPRKRKGYLRSIGQEIPKEALLTAIPATDLFRQYLLFGDGPQTFKNIQPSIDLWIPLLFWTRHAGSALANFLIPYGQTDITVQTAAISDLVSFAVYAPGTGAFNNPSITTAELYSRHIFMLPQIHEIFVKRFGFQLIRVHKQQVERIDQSDMSVELNKIRWPVESMYVAFRPVENLSNSRKWHHNMVLTNESVKMPVSDAASVIQTNDAVYFSESHPINTLEVLAHGTTIYKQNSPEFYNQYLPYQYGSQTLNTPEDQGWYYFPFCFEPGQFQPSGHINISQAREFFLKYSSSYINTTKQVDLIVLADCLNFLYTTDGSAILRFST